MNNKIVNTFLFKYFNKGVIDEKLLELIPIDIYMIINLELSNYLLNKNQAKINFDKFQHELYVEIIEKYKDDLIDLLDYQNKNN